eukprot:scaffold9347_cov110-Isochrysis_galbana.AAC.7
MGVLVLALSSSGLPRRPQASSHPHPICHPGRGSPPSNIWRCTLKRFADLALALAHDARTKQLLAIGRGEPPPSLNSHQARLSPLATLDEEAELFFSDELHNHLIE